MRHVLKMRDKKMKKVDLKGFETGRLKVVEKAGKDMNGAHYGGAPVHVAMSVFISRHV